MAFSKDLSLAWNDFQQDEEKFYAEHVIRPFAKIWGEMDRFQRDEIVDNIVVIGNEVYGDYEFVPDEIKSTFAYFQEEPTEQTFFEVEPTSVMAFAGRGSSPVRRRDTVTDLQRKIEFKEGLIALEQEKGNKADTNLIDQWNEAILVFQEGIRQKKKKTGQQFGSAFTIEPTDPTFSWIKLLSTALMAYLLFSKVGNPTNIKFPYDPITRDEFDSITNVTNIPDYVLESLREYQPVGAYFAGTIPRDLDVTEVIYMEGQKQIDARSVPTVYLAFVPSSNETLGLSNVEKQDMIGLIGKTTVENNDKVYNAVAVIPESFEGGKYTLTLYDDVNSIEDAFFIEVPVNMEIYILQDDKRTVAFPLLDNDIPVRKYRGFVANPPLREELSAQQELESLKRKYQDPTKSENELLDKIGTAENAVIADRFWPVLYAGGVVMWWNGALKDFMGWFGRDWGDRFAPPDFEFGLAIGRSDTHWKAHIAVIFFLAFLAIQYGFIPLPKEWPFEFKDVDWLKALGFAKLMETISEAITPAVNLFATLLTGFFVFLTWAFARHGSAKLPSQSDIASALRATNGDVKAAAKMLSSFSL